MLWIGLFLASVSIQGAVGVNITVAPNNTAAMTGQSSYLHCSAVRGTDSVEWEFNVNGSTEVKRIYLYNDDEVQTPYANYVVNLSQANQGIFDLNILEVAPQTAGFYTCSLFSANIRHVAEFVSVSPLHCDPPPGEWEVMAGARVLLTCEVTYVGYKPPALRWTSDFSSAPLTGEWVWNYERSTLVVNVTAEAAFDMLDYTCDVMFTSSSSDTKPPPVYSDSCTTHFFVLHGPTSMEIVPDPDGVVNMDVGDFINCSASGRPYPEFTWMDDIGDVVSDSSVMIVSGDWAGLQKILTCFARNEINGQPFSADMSITIFVSTPAPTPVTSTGGVEPWVIAVAVIIPIVIIGAIVGIIFGCKSYKKKKAKKEHSQLPDGSTPGSPVRTMMPDPWGDRPQPRPNHKSQSNGYSAPSPVQMLLASGASMPSLNNTVTDQHHRSGGDSPGYGDLGIKQFSSINGLDVSNVDLDPDPKFVTRQASRPSLAGSRGFSVSQGSLGMPPPSHVPPSLPLANHPMNMHNQSVASSMVSQNMANMQQQQMHQQRRPSTNSNQPSMMQSRGPMGSRGSLASQGSRTYNHNVYQLPEELTDTMV